MLEATARACSFLTAAAAAACVSACSAALPAPTVFDASKPSAVLHLGVRSGTAGNPRYSRYLVLCLSGLRDANGVPLEFPEYEVHNEREIHLNEGTYSLVLSRCLVTCPGSDHDPLTLVVERNKRYRALVRDAYEGMESNTFKIAVVDDADGATITEISAQDCVLSPGSI